MARVAAVRMSGLGGRWDAEFHVALSELGSRVEELSRTVPPDEVARRLDAIPLRDRQALKVLSRRGDRRGVGTDESRRLVAEHPYLALALVERSLAPAVERVRAEIARGQASLDALLAIATPHAGAGAEPSPGPRPT